MEAPRQLPVPDAPARAGATCPVRQARRQAGEGPLGGAEIALHAAVRAVRHRRAVGDRRSRRGAHPGYQLGRGARHHGARRGSWDGRREHTVPEYIGLDEKAIARGHTYATIVCDLSNGRVIDVAPDRTTESVYRCLRGLLAQRAGGHQGRRHGHVAAVHPAMTTLLPDAGREGSSSTASTSSRT